MRKLVNLALLTALIAGMLAAPSTAAAKGKPQWPEAGTCVEKASLPDSKWTAATDGYTDLLGVAVVNGNLVVGGYAPHVGEAVWVGTIEN